MTGGSQVVEACSAASIAAGEPLIGSAPDAVGWVCLEQNGPWGPKAWTSSHLDPALGAAIESAAGRHGVRPALVRRPGRHADEHTSTARRVLVAHTRPGAAWLLAGTLSAPDALLALDLAAVAAGDRDRVIASLPALRTSPPQLLVCTNGTRDTCCARLGRPVAESALARHPEAVWEVTHTSGHRFAPTTVLLPSGTLHGRVLDAAALLDAAVEGRLVLDGFRGRSTWTAAGQVAEHLVRRQFHVAGLDDLVVSPADSDWHVSHRDGRVWRVRVTAYVDGERPESCGKDSVPVTRYDAAVVG